MAWLKQINVEKYIEMVTNWLTTYSVKIIAALLILVIGKWLARRITNLITKRYIFLSTTSIKHRLDFTDILKYTF
ncbi:hypothetical protein [uncultured Desulfobacter sp.]|uniref:mechanosensitive ion channel family protein n=1 Tax=uncultured Desulfobacter sp. TaxID=240139 RepID=UPI0029F4B5D3|nr:hypothetical protein [uncultured Desulfobacter sp.]